jgi:ABC-type histidine transport system ATPase subunit
MDHGQIVEQGRPDEVFAAPKTQRLSEFLGRVMAH